MGHAHADARREQILRRVAAGQDPAQIADAMQIQALRVREALAATGTNYTAIRKARRAQRVADQAFNGTPLAEIAKAERIALSTVKKDLAFLAELLQMRSACVGLDEPQTIDARWHWRRNAEKACYPHFQRPVRAQPDRVGLLCVLYGPKAD